MAADTETYKEMKKRWVENADVESVVAVLVRNPKKFPPKDIIDATARIEEEIAEGKLTRPSRS